MSNPNQVDNQDADANDAAAIAQLKTLMHCVDCCKGEATGKCCCDSYPKAVWRRCNGKEVFSGVVMLDDQMAHKYLDDPSGALTGPGHIMADEEYFSIGVFYDTQPGAPSYDNYKTKLVDVPLLDFSKLPPMIAAQMLMNFEGQPYDIGLPFTKKGAISSLVKANDGAKVIAMGKSGFKEGFWVTISSVTPKGEIVARSNSNLNFYTDVKRGTLMTLTLNHILAVEKGPYWELGCDDPRCKEWKYGGKTFMFCSKCRKCQYCSKECQKKHWKVHKKVCQRG